MSKLLSSETIEKELAKLDVEWSLIGGTQLSRVYNFNNFAEGLVFVIKAGRLAEKLNHHPDVSLSWDKVVLTLTTHRLGGLSLKDFEFAKQI